MRDGRSQRVLIEVAVDSGADAVAAWEAGADRLELCAELEKDGLTPRVEVVREVVGAVGIPVVAMVRPREGGFVAEEEDVRRMEREAGELAAAGASGLVFGVLDARGEIDRRACERVMRQCGGREAVFHRAFDGLRDMGAGLEVLIDLGFKRVLTAGRAGGGVVGSDTADDEGVRRLAALQARARGRIEVLPGGGIRPGNVGFVVERTGCRQVHSSCREGRTFRAAMVGELRRGCSFTTENTGSTGGRKERVESE